jgi:hypothetical protein
VLKYTLIKALNLVSFISKHEEEIENLKIKVFEINHEDATHVQKLQNLLIDKVKSMKIHQNILEENHFPPGFDEEFIKNFRDSAKSIITPEEHSIPWFDVRRSRLTEFMSQIYLEKEIGCVFFDKCDKKINLEAFEVDNHAKGIDVVGIKDHNNDFKFVVCEVKVSNDIKIPCKTSKDLKEDILKSKDNSRRVLKEVITLLQCLTTGKTSDELNSVLKLLLELVNAKDSKEILYKNIVFMPFLIKRNENIVKDNNVDDLKQFMDIKDICIEGFLWSFNDDIDTFVKNAYNIALEEIA